jgi:transcription initiation factor TFIIF subunit beta
VPHITLIFIEHTAFVAAPDHEVHCTPRETPEWERLQARKEAIKRQGIKEMRVEDINVQQTFTRTDLQGDRFIKASDIKKPRTAGNKYQRMEEEDLINHLAQCFREFRFWTIKALQDRLKQPEAHLREVLGKIAYLVKSGTAANTWTLRPEVAATLLGEESHAAAAAANSNIEADDIAPAGEDDEDEFDEEDDDMEDVDLDI